MVINSQGKGDSLTIEEYRDRIYREEKNTSNRAGLDEEETIQEEPS